MSQLVNQNERLIAELLFPQELEAVSLQRFHSIIWIQIGL